MVNIGICEINSLYLHCTSELLEVCWLVDLQMFLCSFHFSFFFLYFDAFLITTNNVIL